MKKLIYVVILGLFTTITFASNQSTWRPGKKHRCGFKKFKCPAAKNVCIRRPKKSKCEVLKIKGNRIKKTSYEDYCAKSGYTCSGSYSSCIDGQYSVSVGGTQNPYAACAP